MLNLYDIDNGNKALECFFIYRTPFYPFYIETY
jgi:hypothetical protein